MQFDLLKVFDKTSNLMVQHRFAYKSHHQLFLGTFVGKTVRFYVAVHILMPSDMCLKKIKHRVYFLHWYFEHACNLFFFCFFQSWIMKA